MLGRFLNHSRGRGPNFTCERAGTSTARIGLQNSLDANEHEMFAYRQLSKIQGGARGLGTALSASRTPGSSSSADDAPTGRSWRDPW